MRSMTIFSFVGRFVRAAKVAKAAEAAEAAEERREEWEESKKRKEERQRAIDNMLHSYIDRRMKDWIEFLRKSVPEAKVRTDEQYKGVLTEYGLYKIHVPQETILGEIGEWLYEGDFFKRIQNFLRRLIREMRKQCLRNQLTSGQLAVDHTEKMRELRAKERELRDLISEAKKKADDVSTEIRGLESEWKMKWKSLDTPNCDHLRTTNTWSSVCKVCGDSICTS